MWWNCDKGKSQESPQDCLISYFVTIFITSFHITILVSVRDAWRSGAITVWIRLPWSREGLLMETALPLPFTTSQTKIGKQMWWKVPCSFQWMANLFMRLWVGQYKVWLCNSKIGLIFVKHFYEKLIVQFEHWQKIFVILNTDFPPSPKFLTVILNYMCMKK